MSHWMKRTLGIALISVFVVSLVACGKSTNNQSNATQASQTPTAQKDGKITVQDEGGR